MRTHFFIALILASALASALAAQETAPVIGNSPARRSNAQDHAEPAATKPAVEQPGRAAFVQTAAIPSDSRRSDSGTKLSSGFTNAALNAAFQLQSTERRVEQSIKRGFPLGEFWIENDLAEINDSITVAALNAKNEADLEALRRLEMQSSQLRLWTDWLIDANRNLRLAEYYINSSALDNDDRFQNTVNCTRYLVAMLSSRKLVDNSFCQ